MTGPPRTPPNARRYGGQSPAERTAERRDRLIRSTIELLASQGEPATTMTKICAQAGLTERYYYESFSRREEVLVAALDLAAKQVADAAVATIAQTDGDQDQRVRAGMTAVVELAVADPAPVRVVLLESAGNAALRTRRHELLTWFAEVAAEESAAILGAAAWPPQRARLQATVFVAGYAELVGFWLRGEQDLTPEGLIEIGTELFDLLLRRPHPPG